MSSNQKVMNRTSTFLVFCKKNGESQTQDVMIPVSLIGTKIEQIQSLGNIN